VLAFSTIMLNTSLHNPASKTKPTLEMFLNMNRGIDQGKSLDDAFLSVTQASVFLKGCPQLSPPSFSLV
jgi:Sec7-like guanine-nucleotide exchange factor